MLDIQQHAVQLDKLHISGPKRAWLAKTMVYEGTDEVRSGVAGLLQAREDMVEVVNTDTEDEEE